MEGMDNECIIKCSKTREYSRKILDVVLNEYMEGKIDFNSIICI